MYYSLTVCTDSTGILSFSLKLHQRQFKCFGESTRSAKRVFVSSFHMGPICQDPKIRNRCHGADFLVVGGAGTVLAVGPWCWHWRQPHFGRSLSSTRGPRGWCPGSVNRWALPSIRNTQRLRARIVTARYHMAAVPLGLKWYDTLSWYWAGGRAGGINVSSLCVRVSFWLPPPAS